MAFTTGTASSADNMLDQLITYIELQGWTATEPVSGPSAAPVNERHVYLESPFITGIGNVYIQIRYYFSLASGYYNWEIRAATEYDSAVSFDEQPGVSNLGATNRATPTLTLFNSSMDFWFIVSDRRFIVLAIVDTVRVNMYAGLYLPYALSSEFGYPIYIGASSGLGNSLYSIGTTALGSFWDPAWSGGVNHAGLLRHYDGTWVEIYNYTYTSNNRQNTNLTGVWPYYELNTDGVEKIVSAPDSSYPLLPHVLTSSLNDGNVYGELEGTFYVPELGLLSEDTLNIAGTDYLVVQPVYRSNTLGYAAIRLT